MSDVHSASVVANARSNGTLCRRLTSWQSGLEDATTHQGTVLLNTQVTSGHTYTFRHHSDCTCHTVSVRAASGSGFYKENINKQSPKNKKKLLNTREEERNQQLILLCWKFFAVCAPGKVASCKFPNFCWTGYRLNEEYHRLYRQRQSSQGHVPCKSFSKCNLPKENWKNTDKLPSPPLFSCYSINAGGQNTDYRNSSVLSDELILSVNMQRALSYLVN